MILPIAQRRNPCHFLKRTVEMGNMLEADHLSYKMYLLTGSSQQLLCFTDADDTNILADMETGQPQEDAA